MPKIIALQPNNQQLASLLRHQGYTVIDMYQAHSQRETVDAYLYTTYHPDAFTAYHSLSEPADIILGSTWETNHLPKTIMLNITNMQPEQILMKLNRRLEENHQHLESFT
jgi:hypothetical protein